MEIEYVLKLMQDRKVIAQLAKNHQGGATEEEFSLTKLLANINVVNNCCINRSYTKRLSESIRELNL